MLFFYVCSRLLSTLNGNKQPKYYRGCDLQVSKVIWLLKSPIHPSWQRNSCFFPLNVTIKLFAIGTSRGIQDVKNCQWKFFPSRIILSQQPAHEGVLWGDNVVQAMAFARQAHPWISRELVCSLGFMKVLPFHKMPIYVGMVKKKYRVIGRCPNVRKVTVGRYG